MFQAKVLIGEYVEGKHDMTCPPRMYGKGHKRFDLCVDDRNNPSIFVVFDRSKCYPEYLIAYEAIHENTRFPIWRSPRTTAMTWNQPALGTISTYGGNSLYYPPSSNQHTLNQAGASSNHQNFRTPPMPLAHHSSAALGNLYPTWSRTNSGNSDYLLATNTQQDNAMIQPSVPSVGDKSRNNHLPSPLTRSSGRNVSLPVKKKRERRSDVDSIQLEISSCNDRTGSNLLPSPSAQSSVQNDLSFARKKKEKCTSVDSIQSTAPSLDDQAGNNQMPSLQGESLKENVSFQVEKENKTRTTFCSIL
jgi:hypothetical protein